MAATINGVMVKKFSPKIKLYYVNNFFYGLKKKILLEKKNFFLTSNLTIYQKFKKFKNVYYSESLIKNYQVRKYYLKNINEWHNMLKQIDLSFNKLLRKQNLKLNENLYIGSYMYRYFAFSEYCRIIFIKKNIIKFQKKHKFDSIVILGKLDLKYFNQKILLQYLKESISQKVFLRNYKIDKPIMEKSKNIYNIFNKKNIFLFYFLFKRTLFNFFIKFFKQPSSLLIKQERELLFENVYPYYLLDKIYKNNNKKILINRSNKILLKSNNINIIFQNYIFNKILEYFQNHYYSIFELKKKFIKLNVKNIKSDLEDINIKSYFAIYVAKLLNLKIIGYQHGSEYGVNKHKDIDHTYLCYRFVDEFRIWGFSKFFNKMKKNIFNKKVKFLKIGSRSGNFLKNFMNFDVDHNDLRIMYVPSVVRADYFDAKSIQDPNWQINLQSLIVKSLYSKYLSKFSLSVPNFTYENCLNFFPLEFNEKINHIKVFRGAFKDNLLKYKPNILIFDRLSTALYESLDTNCKIIVFMDPLCIPKNDILLKLQKRVEIIYEYKNIDKILNNKLKNRILNKNNEFKNSFYYD